MKNKRTEKTMKWLNDSRIAHLAKADTTLRELKTAHASDVPEILREYSNLLVYALQR